MPATSDPSFILGIESSCDETSASVIQGRTVLSNVIANQLLIHRKYGGVVPELASRAHQQKIVPVVEEALTLANITKKQLSAVAFTRGPGLMGALIVGVSFAKALALALDVPLLEVNHMQGHVLAHFLQKSGEDKPVPSFPFLCLTVSGGHTQIVQVNGPLDMQVIGETQDDAAGEAFDKAAKILGLPYPGGPLIDQHAAEGNPDRYRFPHPKIPDLDYSFSGLKTSFLYFIRDLERNDPTYKTHALQDICASLQQSIVRILLEKLVLASRQRGIRDIAIAGGVSANSGLRKALIETGASEGWSVFIPPFEYCTDNAAMIACAGSFLLEAGQFSSLDTAPMARMPF